MVRVEAVVECGDGGGGEGEGEGGEGDSDSVTAATGGGETVLGGSWGRRRGGHSGLGDPTLSTVL